MARMYYNNGGDSWTSNTNWLNNESHCSWTGTSISCDYNSHVTEVNLSGNNVSGSMIDLLGVSALSTVVLNFNNMAGPIPSGVCDKVVAGSLFL